jgi:hypothetical protein
MYTIVLTERFANPKPLTEQSHAITENTKRDVKLPPTQSLPSSLGLEDCYSVLNWMEIINLLDSLRIWNSAALMLSIRMVS